MTIQQQWAGCGRLWRALDSETQRQYDDPEFLKTLPKPFLAFNEEDVEGESEMPGLAGPSLARKDKPRGGKHKRASKFVPVRWGRKILADVSILSCIDVPSLGSFVLSLMMDVFYFKRVALPSDKLTRCGRIHRSCVPSEAGAIDLSRRKLG